MRPIYLDHHATTPVDPRVAEAIWPYFTEKFGNASGRHHRYGWEADEAVEKARAQVAGVIGARAREVIFTSGATESNNLALKGVLHASARRRHIVTVTTEHASVLDPCKRLVADGARVTQVPVMRDGLVDLDRLRDAVTDETVVVSVMAANNEIGVLQPLAAVAAIAHERGAWFHTDAVQAIGKVPFDVEATGADLVSMTAHKFYGPKGVGALYIRRRSTFAQGASAFAPGATADRTADRPRVEMTPQLDGGGQERGLRSGTLNVPGIVGLGAAAELAAREMPEEAPRLRVLRDRLLKALVARVPDIVINGTLDPPSPKGFGGAGARLPGNLNVSFPGVDGEALLIGLEDVAVSSGAACTASQPSHVLRALGHPVDLALASLRFGLGRSTTEADVDVAAERVSELVARLRSRAYAGATSPGGMPGRKLQVEAGLRPPHKASARLAGALGGGG